MKTLIAAAALVALAFIPAEAANTKQQKQKQQHRAATINAPTQGSVVVRQRCDRWFYKNMGICL